MALPSDSPAWLAPALIIAASILQKLDSMAVRRRLEKSAKERDQKLDSIHGLVNGRMAESLRASMVQTARIAQLTKDLPGGELDAKIAADAARNYEEHMERMIRIDLAQAKGPQSGP